MGHEIRKHMADVDGENMLSGVVEIDETYVGGKRPGKRGRGAAGKTIVFGMMERNGDVMTKIVPNVRKVTLQSEIIENVEKGATVHTDELHAYKGLDQKGYEHDTVNHGAKQYVDGDCHVNGIEGYWRNLKAGINGTHIHVSGKHLDKYAKEFEYRFNRRNRPDTMLPELLTKFSPT